MEWSWELKSGFFSILVDVFVDTLDESVLESFLNLIFSPWVKLFGSNLTSSSSFDSIKSLLLILSIVNKLLDMISIIRLVKDHLIKELS